MSYNGRQPNGFSLLELLVTLTLLSLMAGIVTLGWRRVARVSSAKTVTIRILAARDSALRTGHPVTIWMADSATGADGLEVTALPDGRLLATDTLAINSISGGVHGVHRTP